MRLPPHLVAARTALDRLSPGAALDDAIGEALDLVGHALAALLPSRELGESLDLELAALHTSLAAEEFGRAPVPAVVPSRDVPAQWPALPGSQLVAARALLIAAGRALRRQGEAIGQGRDGWQLAQIHVAAAHAAVPRDHE